ncbi:hypothetical protein KA005_08670, partial [bacterium]|nr:hypothetical protein [bacterium]
YRPSFSPYEHPYLRLYIHNTYLSLWLKTGLVGLVSFLWFSLVFIRRGFRQWRHVQNGFLRSIMLGFTVGYVGMMLSNLVSPSMLEDMSLVIFGLVLGFNETVLLHTEAPPMNATTQPSKEEDVLMVEAALLEKE